MPQDSTRHLAPARVARDRRALPRVYPGVRARRPARAHRAGLRAAGLRRHRDGRRRVPPGPRRRINISAFLFLAAAWGLYVLLRPVNAELVLLFLLLNAVGVAIQCASMIPLLAALLTAGRAQPPAVVLRSAAGGPLVPVDPRLPDGVRHGPAVLRHVAVPAGLPRLQVPRPPAGAERPARARRGRRRGLVPPGHAPAGPARARLPGPRRELRRGGSGSRCGSSSGA